jgi:hypothetical protein
MPNRKVTFKKRTQKQQAKQQQAQPIIVMPQTRRQAPQNEKKKRPNAGARLGGSLWTAGKTLFKDILGWGDYEINRNSLMPGSQVPTMHGSKDSVRIKHREYISDVSTSVLFQTQTFPINPGLGQSFPWLCNVADSFQEYDICGMVYEFVPTSSEVISGTNAAMGSVSMACQYRADLGPFTSKLAMLNSEFSVDGKPSEPLMFPIECDPKEKPLDVQYIRTGQLGTGLDVKFFDLGVVTLATVGSQAAYTCGELWVTYDIILYKPTGAVASTADQLVFAATTVGAPTTANPFANMVVYDYQGGPANRNNTPGAATNATSFINDGGAFSSQSNFGIMTLPAGLVGTFAVTYAIAGSAAVALTNIGSWLASNNCSFIAADTFGNYPLMGTTLGTAGFQVPVAGTSSAEFLDTVYITISTAQAALGGATIKFGTAGGITLPTAPVAAITIMQIGAQYAVV